MLLERNGAARAIAEHEARHVIAAKACGMSIEHATIDPEVAPVGAAGCVQLTIFDLKCKPLQEFSDRTLQEIIGEPPIIDGAPLSRETCVFMYARVIGAVAGSGRKDLQQATVLADIVSSKPAAFLHFARADAARILAANRSQIAAIADALMIERTLDDAAIDEILAGMLPAMRAEKLRRREWATMAAGAEAFRLAHGGLMRLNL